MSIYAYALAIVLSITALIVPSTALPGSFTPLSADSAPLRTCYQTVQADINWFAIAWKSGNNKDKSTCKNLKSLLGKEVTPSSFKCSWYWNDIAEEGLTKATGYLNRKEGMERNALTNPIETLWGEGASKACMLE